MDTLPEILISQAAEQAQSKHVRRLAAAGRLRKLYAGVYSSNLKAHDEAVVLRNWREIVGHLLPGAVVSHRSRGRRFESEQQSQQRGSSHLALFSLPSSTSWSSCRSVEGSI